MCNFSLSIKRVCCPDNAITTTSTTVSTITTTLLDLTSTEGTAEELPKNNSSSTPTLRAFDEIKSHQNIHLINDKRCGASYVNYIVGLGATEAAPGEFPWMFVFTFNFNEHDS